MVNQHNDDYNSFDQSIALSNQDVILVTNRQKSAERSVCVNNQFWGSSQFTLGERVESQFQLVSPPESLQPAKIHQIYQRQTKDLMMSL